MQKIALIYNSKSGAFLEQGVSACLNQLSTALRAYPATQVQWWAVQEQTWDVLEQAVQAFAPDRIWVVGGDGTVLSVAQLAMRLHKPLGVLPGGTMNLLARDLGMALDLPAAIAQLVQARLHWMDVAEVNGQPFLCISNLGISTKLTERREQLRPYPMWLRWPLLAWHLLKFLFTYPSSRVRLYTPNRRVRLHTHSVTVSNNPLAPHSSIIPVRERLDQGQLGVYVTKDSSLWSLPRLVWRLLGKTWHQDPDLLRFNTEQMVVNFKHKRHVMVMCDGELHRLRLPLRYRIWAKRLCVLQPPCAA